MEKLPPPLKRHLMGAYPPYASLKGVLTAFEGLLPDHVYTALEATGLLEGKKASEKAKEEGYVASCEGKLLWSVEAVEALLTEGGMKVRRLPQNQEVEVPLGDPVWANLGTIGTYFSASAPQVGKWLDALGLREETGGMPTEDSLKGGLATLVEMHVEGKKTRKVAHWNLHLIKAKLVEAGHVLDFNYEDSLKGKGKNGDVEVTGIDARAREVFLEWKALYQNPETRRKSWDLFRTQPKAIIVRVEELLGKPRFIQDKKYLSLR